MPTVHAKYSPSGAKTWFACPGAIPLITKLNLKDSGSSIYADRGTAMHGVMEMCLTENKKPSEFVGWKMEPSPGVFVTIDTDMAKLVKQATDYVNGLDPDVMFCEEKVEVLPDYGVFGTVDVIAVCGDTLEIVDLKTGRGPVEAFRNLQLMIYMIGAYREFGKDLSLRKFKVTIVQPVVYDEPQSYEFDLTELLAFEEETIAAVKRSHEEPHTFVPTEEGCRWCRARHVCPAQRRLMDDVAAVDFKDVADLPKDDLAEVYAKVEEVKRTIKAIEEETLRRLVAGTPVKGFRLAPSSTQRSWDPDKQTKLEKALSKLFDEDVYMTEPGIKSPAQLEAALKNADIHFSFDEYLKKKEPSPTIVPQTSNKPTWDPNLSAKMDFSE